jgi:hypothetical protein
MCAAAPGMDIGPWCSAEISAALREFDDRIREKSVNLGVEKKQADGVHVRGMCVVTCECGLAKISLRGGRIM